MEEKKAKGVLLELIEEQQWEMRRRIQHSPSWYRAISKAATLTRKWRKTNNLRVV